MNLSISTRAKNTPASAVRKLVPLSDSAKKRGVKVYHLNIGQPDLPTPKPILNAIKSFKQSTVEYAPSTGMLEARSAWQKFYENKGWDFKIEDILITSGGSEGLLFAFFAIADPGDEIIVFEPFYTSYSIAAAMGNIKLHPLATHANDGFHLPPRKIIEKAINKKTRGIIVCNPNNPTGTVYSTDEVKMIADIALKHNLFIISDETYQEIVFDGKKVLPFATFKSLSQHLVIADSVSKRFNSCGARVGCIVSKNKEIMSAVLRFAMSRLSVATVDQLAMIPMLVNHKKYVASIQKIYEKRRNVVVDELKKIPGVSFQIPQGAFYIMPRLPIKDSDDFAAFLLNNFSDRGETVMIAPAGGFYATYGLGKNEIRLAYVLDEKKLKRAIELLRLALKMYKN
ncbi:aspartate aminotransferase [Candidatus Gottesmanbacteria bacterium RIFCSPHIGHO2_01_FULL_39_10]|uniref:Aspartate aminotransferase n=1 Tax=Candidatus Gottesmanbacteria bacterium RIFCSPHIGHO2_01_FULL_39_10 TaxID=1798375 RepID=A0A1F5ZRY2_9BACT|nr:MAG: aspartate aminotransferase [Candidatus Gottesmanbacteria bacterium RIFCSPHIGHO2_01_FULL_39_10]